MMDYDAIERTFGKAASVYADLNKSGSAFTVADGTPDWAQLVRMKQLAREGASLESAVETPLLKALLQIRRGNRERARALLLEVIGQAMRGYEWLGSSGVAEA